MIGKLGEALAFQAQALRLRAERQSILAANIANADTPNYKAVDFNFATALQAATSQQINSNTSAGMLHTTSPRHIAGMNGDTNIPVRLQFRINDQASLDNNSVDMDVERANFADNAIRYEAALRALNNQLRTLQTAVQGNS